MAMANYKAEQTMYIMKKKNGTTTAKMISTWFQVAQTQTLAGKIRLKKKNKK